jgi:hypothetical protein
MKYLFFLFVSFPFLLGAQCYGSFEIFGGAGLSATPSSFPNVDKRPVFVSDFGFGASVAVGQRTLLRTSMHYGQYGDRAWTGPNGLKWGSQRDGMGGYDPYGPGEPDLEPDVVNRHQFIEGTIALRRVFSLRGPWRPFMEGGISFGKYVTSVNRTVNEEAASETIRRFRSASPIGRLGIGADYNFNDHVGMYAMPVLQCHLRSLNERGLTKVMPWRVTLEIGVRVFVDPR